MIKAGIIGATGYAGAELCRLLFAHPDVEIAAVSSVSFEGQALSEIYPAYRGFLDNVCTTQEAVIEAADVVFAALPHGLSEPLAEECRKKGRIFIDLGADFRLESEESYRAWYGLSYAYPELHKEVVYGLPELFRSEIKGKTIVANPGCYTTAVPLVLVPALRAGLIESHGIIADCKSGVTGAGRGLSQTTHFADLNEGFAAYKVATHRHTPEIEQTLTRCVGEEIKLTFVPHLLPINRGILATCYATLKPGVTEEQLRETYEATYAGEFFVRLLPKGRTADVKAVRCSNFCDISLHTDEHTGTFIAISTLDNMVKGAAGQAIQNMNILCGLEESAGLQALPPAF